jgi:hypothetical protein
MNIHKIYNFLKEIQDDINCNDVRISFCNKKLYLTAYKEMENEYCSYRQIYPEGSIEKNRHSGNLSTLKQMFINEAKERFDRVANEKNKNKNPNNN